MGCRIIHDERGGMAVLYCSTSDWAFGPVFQEDSHHDAYARAESFLRWIETTPTWANYEKAIMTMGRHDPRELTERGVERAYSDWLVQEAEQWQCESSMCEICGDPTVNGHAVCVACQDALT